jgi:cell division protein ZipA
MHNAAKKLAEEFGGQILDNTRSVMTMQTVRHYVEKIREFQRQLLIRS